MFNFLKEILGVPKPVEVVGYENSEVLIRSEKPLDLGVVNVLAEINDVKIKAQVQIVESAEDVCRCLWVAPTEALPFLIEVFSPNESRIDPRYVRSLRVRSPQLAEYQGNTVDLSQRGMRLLGKGIFKMGDTMDISFELDDRVGTRLNCRAQICWLAPSYKDEWIAIGIKYIDLNERDQPEPFYLYQQFLQRIGNPEDLQV